MRQSRPGPQYGELRREARRTTREQQCSHTRGWYGNLPVFKQIVAKQYEMYNFEETVKINANLACVHIFRFKQIPGADALTVNYNV